MVAHHYHINKKELLRQIKLQMSVILQMVEFCLQVRSLKNYHLRYLRFIHLLRIKGSKVLASSYLVTVLQ